MPTYPRYGWNLNHGCEQPSRMIFYDTETVSEASHNDPEYKHHRLLLGCASLWINTKGIWQRKEHIRFTKANEFWEFCYDSLRGRRPTWCYSHNSAFDFTVLQGWNEIDSARLRITEKVNGTRRINGTDVPHDSIWRGKTALDGTPFILECRHDRGPVKFVDTYNYWPVPLAKLGEWLSLPKLDMPDFDTPSTDWWVYCERDVEIIEAAVLRLLKLWKGENLGNWQPTIASLAYSSFRHTQVANSLVSHGDEAWGYDVKRILSGTTGASVLDPKDVTAVERRSYYGGKTTCYFIGDIVSGCSPGVERRDNLFSKGRPEISGPITVLDVNSMYAFIMRDFIHPVELIDSHVSPPMSQAERLIQEFPCCADVQLENVSDPFPVRRNNGVIYPKGSYSTTLFGTELLRAVKQGIVGAVVNLCVFREGRPFARFVEYWHSRRIRAIEELCPIDARFCNQIMQSLYGKLAQMTPLWSTDGLTQPPIRWGTYIGNPKGSNESCVMRAIAGVSQYQLEKRSCRHTFVAGAASITSHAREYMRHLISLCPYRSIVYMDTDSLFVTNPALERLNQLGLIHPTELGKLKVKGVYNYVRIWGPKDYEIDDVRVIAGLRSDAAEISERLWEQINFEGIKSIVSHDPSGEILSNTVRFAPIHGYHDSAVGFDGWTEPIKLD